MPEILQHSPDQNKKPVITYHFLESELLALDEVFNLLFKKLEEEQSTKN